MNEHKPLFGDGTALRAIFDAPEPEYAKLETTTEKQRMHARWLAADVRRLNETMAAAAGEGLTVSIAVESQRATPRDVTQLKMIVSVQTDVME